MYEQMLVNNVLNCCTIDWFHEWPEEALVNVAKGQMTEEDLQLGAQLDPLIQMFKFIHTSLEHRSVDYLSALRRHNYPHIVLGATATVQDAAQREAMGGEESAVVMMEQISKDKASEIVKKVEKEEHEAQEKADEAESLQAQAQTELDQAIPLLEKAVEVLNSIKVADLMQVKSYSKPPGAVRKTMEVACLFFIVPPVPTRTSQAGNHRVLGRCQSSGSGRPEEAAGRPTTRRTTSRKHSSRSELRTSRKTRNSPPPRWLHPAAPLI